MTLDELKNRLNERGAGVQTIQDLGQFVAIYVDIHKTESFGLDYKYDVKGSRLLWVETTGKYNIYYFLDGGLNDNPGNDFAIERMEKEFVKKLKDEVRFI